MRLRISSSRLKSRGFLFFYFVFFFDLSQICFIENCVDMLRVVVRGCAVSLERAMRRALVVGRRLACLA